MRGEGAQDTYEYMLVVGAVVVAVALGLFAFDAVIAGFMQIVCPAVDPVGFNSALECITQVGG